MRFHALNLPTDVFFEVIESIEMGRLAGNRSRLLGQLRTEFVLFHLQQAAVGVVDDNELLRVEQMVRNNQRADGIVCSYAAGIADHVGIAGAQAETMLEQDAGIHAGKHGGVAPRTDREVA
jgi:hypothetical protein